jgi:hypothetical protein
MLLLAAVAVLQLLPAATARAGAAPSGDNLQKPDHDYGLLLCL